jgi:hypothetical protein
MRQNKRFDELRKVPAFAAVDHRFFLDDKGEDQRLSKLSRAERRKLQAEGRKIGAKYKQIVNSIRESGVGYPVDQLLRDLTVEYTHRYAASGVMNQPVSFNYFEAFCAIKLIENSFAPYAEPVQEVDHLFNVADYFDYLTEEETPKFNLSDLRALAEGKTYHFTQNGSINDFTYMTSEGQEFVISDFSMVRRGNSLHWYVLGGEVLSAAEWQERSELDLKIEIKNIAPSKRRFLSQSIKENGNAVGAPVPLQGTKTAIRTVIAGETDLTTSKHVGRYYMSETENSFGLFCDDPDVVSIHENACEREKLITEMQRQVESAAVMWNLAEGFFQLFNYFQYRVTVSPNLVKASEQPAPKAVKGGRGVGAQFKHVASIEVSDIEPSVVRSYTPPYFEVETEGHWRRLSQDSYGQDREGKQVKGRTWVKATNKWRERPDQPRTVYIKSSVAAAKIRVSGYLEAACQADLGKKQPPEQTSVLYVMRCLAMQEEVYKVGWTSNSAEQRARELSAATGVPVSFAVVDAWQHPDPEALEKGVHAMLSPYRLNEGREFFRLIYPDLKAIIEAEIARSMRSKTKA